MADDPKPGGSETPAPNEDQAAGKPAKPAAPAPSAPAPKAPAPKPAAAGGAAAPPKAPPVMAATPWESELSKGLKERFGDRITEASTYLGQNFIVARPEAVISILDYLKL